MGIFEDLKKKGATAEEINIVGNEILSKLKEKKASQQEINIVTKELQSALSVESSPNKPLKEEPKRSIPKLFEEAFRVGFGDDAGKVKFLKQRYEDAKINDEGALVVKDQGKWKYFNQPGLSLSDIPNLYGHTIVPTFQGLGGAGGFLAGGAPGAIGGASLAGASGENLRQDIGKLLGTQSQSDFGSVLTEGLLGGIGEIPGAFIAAKSVAKPLIKTTKGSYFEIGNKIGEITNKLRTDYGVKLGKVKEVLKSVKLLPEQASQIADLNQSIIVNLENELAQSATPAGGSTFNRSERVAIERVIKELSSKVGHLNAEDLFNVKELIRNNLVNVVKKSKPVLENKASNAERILFDTIGQIDDVLKTLDDPFLGGTGKLAKANSEFSNVADLYDDAKSILGTEKNLSSNVKKLGEEIASGNPYHQQFVSNLEDYAPQKYKFMNDLDPLIKKEKLLKTLENLPFAGPIGKTSKAAIDYTGSVLGQKASPLIDLLQGTIGKRPEIPTLLSPGILEPLRR